MLEKFKVLYNVEMITDGQIIDVILMHIFDSMCFSWCVFKRKKKVVALSFIGKFSIFQKWEYCGRVFLM